MIYKPLISFEELKKKYLFFFKTNWFVFIHTGRFSLMWFFFNICPFWADRLLFVNKSVLYVRQYQSISTGELNNIHPLEIIFALADFVSFLPSKNYSFEYSLKSILKIYDVTTVWLLLLSSNKRLLKSTKDHMQ